MTDNEIRIEIAKVMNWTIHHGGKYCAVPNAQGTRWAHLLFDPLEDLNAMHEAECVLMEKCKYWPDYVDELVKLVTNSYPHLPGERLNDNWAQTVHATSRQRSEAFLRVLDLWK